MRDFDAVRLKIYHLAFPHDLEGSRAGKFPLTLTQQYYMDRAETAFLTGDWPDKTHDLHRHMIVITKVGDDIHDIHVMGTETVVNRKMP